MFFDAPICQDNEINHKPSAIIYHVNLSSFFSKMIKIPKKDSSENDSYQNLPRTTSDEAKIEDLITTLGGSGYYSLLIHHEKRLRKIETDIRYLHPFKFLGYIFSRPNLKKSMRNVFEDILIRKKFVKGLSETIDMYDLRNKLYIHLDSFAKEVNIPSHLIKPYIDKRDWRGLLKFLIYY